jgi:hypothetical protein
MHGLKPQQAKEKQRVEKRGDGGNVLLEVGLDAAGDIGDAKREPVEKQERKAGVEFGKGAALRALDAKNAVEPIEMVEIAGEDAKNFKLEPTHFENDADEANGEDHSGGQAVNSILAQCDGGVAEQEREAGDEL